MAKQRPTRGDTVKVSGGVRGNHIVIGNRNTVTSSSTGNPFDPARDQIAARPEDPKVDKDELSNTVDRIEKEAAKGPQADESKLDRWVGFLAEMAPDVWDVLVTTLTSPIAGIGAVVKKVAERSKAARSAGGSTAVANGDASAAVPSAPAAPSGSSSTAS